MGKVKKSTKKFQTTHLKSAIEKRKRRQIVAKRDQVREARAENKAAQGERVAEIARHKKERVNVEDVSAHQAELQSLKDTQKVAAQVFSDKQEFFEFLEHEDADLLKFVDLPDLPSADEGDDAERQGFMEEEVPGSDEDVGNDDGVAEQEDSPGSGSEDGEGARPGRETLTAEAHAVWLARARHGSLPATVRLVKAFYAAAHFGAEDEGTLPLAYHIGSRSVFNTVLISSLRDLAGGTPRLCASRAVFDAVLGRPESDAPFVPQKAGRWRKAKGAVKTAVVAHLRLLRSLTEPKMLAFALQCTRRLLPYYAPFPALSRALLRVRACMWCDVQRVLELWGSAEETVRIVAFLAIRDMALLLPYPSINDCLKGLYLAYVRNARFAAAQTQGLLTFLANCVVELYGLDGAASYQHAFVYLRQLAVHLRAAYDQRDATHVYNWQTLHALLLWARVLTAHPHLTQLALLHHPLVQLLQGVVALQPAPRYHPLRLHCTRALLLVARLAHPPLFVPTGALLLDVLGAEVWARKPRPTSNKASELAYVLRVAEAQLGTRPYLLALFSEVHYQLAEYFATYARSVAFPDLVVPALVQLRLFCKRCRLSECVGRVRTLVERLEASARLVQASRAVVAFGPAQRGEVERFLHGHAPLPIEVYHTELTARRAQDAALAQQAHDTLSSPDLSADHSADQSAQDSAEESADESASEDEDDEQSPRPPEGDEPDDVRPFDLSTFGDAMDVDSDSA